MAADLALTITLTNSSTCTLTVPSSVGLDGQAYISQILATSPGFFDDAGAYHPFYAVQTITIA